MTNPQIETNQKLTDLESTNLNTTIYSKIKGKILKLDFEDRELLNNKWCLDKDGYAIRRGKRMHRVIMNAPSNLVVDHINHDILDNRKCNLRLVTIQENARNRKKQTGIYKRKDGGKWQAQIMVNYKNIKLGCYNTYQEALEVRKNAEQKYFSR